MEQITINAIGVIHSPYKTANNMPIQGRFKPDVKAWVELKEQYTAGLKDLEGFSHCFILYYFDKSDKEHLQGRPFLEDQTHGIFAIRSPHRSNHIGLSVVRIEKIEQNKLYFSEVDMLDETPVLDIKPYVKYFDCRENAVCGWLEKHFKDSVPERTIIKDSGQ
ncbi:MAG: tRNA (N6-threonylcarbamoyladenosine(37)-N6)-methyltransferase TrmO [Planctomycetota bacterium]